VPRSAATKAAASARRSSTPKATTAKGTPAKAAKVSTKKAAPVKAHGAKTAKPSGELAEVGTRYDGVANALKTEIARGDYEIGTKLPTEFELCRRFGVSRSTIRQALAQLELAGVVKRRRGSGTTVVALEPALRYTLSVVSEADILRFASETILEFTEFGAPVSSVDSRRLRLGASGDWRLWRGLRQSTAGGPPLGQASVYVAAPFTGSMKVLGRRTQRAIFDHLAESNGLVISTIEQEITATVIDQAESEALSAAVGTPALSVLRRFISDQRLIEVSETIFPADRFSYEIRLERD
jgi:DNA-binding GntR family transcriptional regulator